jgi:Uncharacterized protein conserved in bacteria (DUF2059)
MKMRFANPAPYRAVFWLMLNAVLLSLTCVSAQAVERGKIDAFLTVTGFDVALDSIALSAKSAPAMLGMDAEMFGTDWERLSDDVFDTSVMHAIALEILEATLDEKLLYHAVEFYATDLGQRLVAAENASHLIKGDEDKAATGADIIAHLKADNPDRLAMFERMNRAIDASGSSLRAMQEVQIRFLLAAAGAGVIELQVDADELRAMIRSQEGDFLAALQQSALEGAAYTYQGFSDTEVEDYTVALEQSEMQQVYELLNAVQFEITANRFEALASRLRELGSGQDI